MQELKETTSVLLRVTVFYNGKSVKKLELKWHIVYRGEMKRREREHHDEGSACVSSILLLCLLLLHLFAVGFISLVFLGKKIKIILLLLLSFKFKKMHIPT